MAGGRPSKYKPEYCDGLIKHMGQGFPYETYGPEIGVGRAVLYDWEKRHPEFLEAKKRAREMQYRALTAIGLQGMRGKITTVTRRVTRTITRKVGGKNVTETTVDETVAPSFNATVWIFFMKNCQGWRDKQDFNEDDEIDSMDWDYGDEKKA